MNKTTPNLQDGFLNQVRKENTTVRVVFVDGSDLSGKIRGFDNFTIVLEDRETHHLIYKHAVAQLVTPRMARPPRNPGEGSGAEHSGPPTAAEPREDRPEPKREDRRGEKREEKPRREGFNTLDLSKLAPPKESDKG